MKSPRATPSRRKSPWRSPLRGPWLTSVFGAVLLWSLPIVILTGLLDYIAYGPQFGQAFPANVGWLHLPYFDWPTRPSWLFRLTEGLHVGLGLILIPVVLAKLWSVLPLLFRMPPIKSVSHAAERASLVLLVGGILFQFVTGVLNIQYDYIFGFSFYTAHYFGAWIFIAGFVAHVFLKFGTMWRSLRSRPFWEVLRTSRADTVSEPLDPEIGLVATDPVEPTLSRRGALGLVGGGAVLVGVLTAGQTIGGFTRNLAFLMPRGGPGNDFPVNRTAQSAGIVRVGESWRLVLRGLGDPVMLSAEQLHAMRQREARLPIACVEGWSTTQDWTGVRLAELAELAGVPTPSSAIVSSLERFGAFNRGQLASNQVLADDALLALGVNGAELPIDHGYPARIIVPGLPGVHNTKWVSGIEFLP